MATLSQDEFTQLVGFLCEDLGVQRLRDKLVAMRGLITRRGSASAEALANQLYQLTGGLRRQVPATIALHGLWAESVQQKLGEEGEKGLETIAEQVNACLAEHDAIAPDKENELDGLLKQYAEHLAAAIGAERARIDMLIKAVPAVAEKLRAAPSGG
jgi:hypothetical protein